MTYELVPKQDWILMNVKKKYKAEKIKKKHEILQVSEKKSRTFYF